MTIAPTQTLPNWSTNNGDIQAAAGRAVIDRTTGKYTFTLAPGESGIASDPQYGQYRAEALCEYGTNLYDIPYPGSYRFDFDLSLPAGFDINQVVGWCSLFALHNGPGGGQAPIELYVRSGALALAVRYANNAQGTGFVEKYLMLDPLSSYIGKTVNLKLDIVYGSPGSVVITQDGVVKAQLGNQQVGYIGDTSYIKQGIYTGGVKTNVVVSGRFPVLTSPIPAAQTQQPPPPTTYALKSDLDAAVARIAALESQIAGLAALTLRVNTDEAKLAAVKAAL